MTTIFLSGSINIRHIKPSVKKRLQNIIDQQFSIVVGDANGADKVWQQCLLDMSYQAVTIFCSGSRCRNNLGQWPVHKIEVEAGVSGREFYTRKDREMAAAADYGFVLWDGKSPGSINNVMELLKGKKKALVYYAPDDIFHAVTEVQDARILLAKCDDGTLDTIGRKIKLNASFNALEMPAQSSLSLGM